jgi:tetratricopeptide (TPR) repeat protein
MQVTHRPLARLLPRIWRIWLLPALALTALAATLWARWDAQVAPAAELVSEAAARRQLSRTDQVIGSYQELVRADPADLDAAAILGDAYLQKARESGDPSYYGMAEALFERALRRDPAHLPALLGQGSLLLARHQFREALAMGERARAASPGVARAYGVIADAQVELGMYDEAVASVQRMVDLRPDLASYSRVSYLRELYGDPEGAIEAMRTAVDARGPTLENTEWTRVQLGNLYLGTGDLAAAEREYTLSLARLPGYVHALAGMARVRTAQGRDEEAAALYEQAVARMPLPEFVIALGELHEAAGGAEQAREQYALVGAMQRLFQVEGADVELELALFEADHGDPARAVELAGRAYERRPGIRGAEALAWALHRGGRHGEASPLIAEAMRLGTQDAVLFARAGLIAHAAGDGAAAREALLRATTISPHLPSLLKLEVERALATLE